MITYNNNQLCKKAEFYYYDFIDKKSTEKIPKLISEHINRCTHCLGQISQLETVLSSGNADLPQNGDKTKSLITMLKLHFAYVGSQVTCNNVRPFLPALLDSKLIIRIPTPITAHLDNCPQCEQDLRTIAELNLSRTQLYRLSQLFSSCFSDDCVNCNQAKDGIMAFVLMAFDEIDKQTLTHLWTCRKCRQAISNYRDVVIKELRREKGQEKYDYCEGLTLSDIYDYCLPYGINSSSTDKSRSLNTHLKHIRGCPACMEKVKELHGEIVDIVERPESEIATIYKVDKAAVRANESYDSENTYAGFPVKVQVVNRTGHSDKPALITNFAAAVKRQYSTIKDKPVLKAGLTTIAAAVMILISVTIFFNAPSANAIPIEQIYRAMENKQNIHTRQLTMGDNQLVQEIWKSRSLDVYISKTDDYFVLWDLAKKELITILLENETYLIQTPTDEMITDMENYIAASFSTTPFHDTELPEGGRLNLVTEGASQSDITGSQLYEMTWLTEMDSGVFVYQKNLYYLQKQSGLPQKIETYQRFEYQQGFEFQTLIEFEYPDESEIKAVLDDFYSLLKNYSISATTEDEGFYSYRYHPFFVPVNYLLLYN